MFKDSKMEKNIYYFIKYNNFTYTEANLKNITLYKDKIKSQIIVTFYYLLNETDQKSIAIESYNIKTLNQKINSRIMDQYLIIANSHEQIFFLFF